MQHGVTTASSLAQPLPVPAQPLLCATGEPSRDLLVEWCGPGHGGPLERMVTTNTSSGTRVLCIWFFQGRNNLLQDALVEQLLCAALKVCAAVLVLTKQLESHRDAVQRGGQGQMTPLWCSGAVLTTPAVPRLSQ